jgi:translocation and assembly module TamB
MTGTLHADANLHGSLRQPIGIVRLDADKLQMKQESGRALPPATLNASATLDGDVANLLVGFSAGSDSNFKVAGTAPLTSAGLFDLHSEATLNVNRFNPILTAEGRSARGQLVVNTKLSGTWSSPSLTGSALVNRGGWQDDKTGIEISDVSAELQAGEGILRVVKLQGRAGPGTISAAGSVGLMSAGFPIDLAFTARNARPFTSDQLTVNLNADISVHGLAAEQLSAGGNIRINRADIRIPERMPASIAILKLSNAAAPPPQPKANSDIALNLTIAAPREIFVRGRGLNTELGGTVHIAGTAKDPRPDGEFKLRSGQFTLAGQVLEINQGSIGFDNGSLTDPSLNLVANTSRNNVAASLTVAGSVRNPKITLSSIPQLPQDEILANLLYGKGSANLSPLEIVQIAATLASLTGVTAGVGDPLENARKFLGLDRLSAGGANPSLEGGRYIAPGVYLGAKQGVTGGDPQATVQIDITKGLKLEGSAGSGTAASPSSSGNSTTNSIGVIYQLDY